MSSGGFLESLRQEKAKAAALLAKREQALGTWKADLESLKQELVRLLKGPVDEGLLTLTEGQMDLREELLGPYTTWTLTIEAPAGAKVQVRPKGLHVVGANGRVDFSLGPKQVMLVRRENGQWSWVVHGVRKNEFAELTEDSLLEALEALFSA